MRKLRRLVSLFVGGIQCGLGGLASVFAYFIYASSSIRDAFAITSEEIFLYMFLLLVFGVVSILSGIILIRKES
jgi:hypothetical protein